MAFPGVVTQVSEHDLIEQARSGDRHAFGELVLLHRPGVVNVIYRMCGDAHLAEDAAQDAFIKAWDKLHTWQPRSAFRNWLYRIATNTALDALRKARPTVDIDDLPIAAGGAGTEARVEQRQRAKLVQQAVLSLPEASRSVLILREYEGLSYREIADTLDIPMGTVMSRLNYARTRLRDILSAVMEA